MNALNRTSIRHLFDADPNDDIDALVHSAAIPGWSGTLDSIPDDAFFGAHDGIINNIYGGTFSVQEAIRYWKARPLKPRKIVIFSSE